MSPRLIAGPVGFALLLVVWAVMTPLNGNPDESAHLLKAVGAATGQWTGGAAPPHPPYASALQRQMMVSTTRSFDVPSRLDVRDSIPCFARRPDIPPSNCEGQLMYQASDPPGRRSSHVGSYPPLAYLPLGVAALASPSVGLAFRDARLVEALWCLLLLTAAWRWAEGPWHRVGILAAAGPLFLSVATSVGTNGTEVAGAIAFMVIGNAVAQGHSSRRTWCWLAFAGCSLAASKSLGAIWLLALVGVLIARFGAGTIADQVRAGRRAAAAAISVIVAAAAYSLIWAVIVAPSGMPAGQVVVQLRSAAHQLVNLLPMLYGYFGWIDQGFPVPTAIGTGLLVSLFAAAVFLGTRRERAALVAAFYIALTGTIAVTALESAAHFGLQARYTLALIVTVPLVASAVLERRQVPRTVMHVAVAAAVTSSILAWAGQAHRYAVGASGSWLAMFTHPQWGDGIMWAGLAAIAVGATGLLAWSTAGPASLSSEVRAKPGFALGEQIDRLGQGTHAGAPVDSSW